MASEEKLSERLQAYIDACSGPGITLYEGHPAVLMREALDDISRLVGERDEARATSQKLNRELQSVGRAAYRNAKAYIRNLHGEWARRRLRTLFLARRALEARYPEDAGVLVDALAERMTARATAAEARVSQLETALKPFAEAADSIDDSEGDRIEMWEHPASMLVTAANFRRARTALSQ